MSIKTRNISQINKGSRIVLRISLSNNPYNHTPNLLLLHYRFRKEGCRAHTFLAHTNFQHAHIFSAHTFLARNFSHTPFFVHIIFSGQFQHTHIFSTLFLVHNFLHTIFFMHNYFLVHNFQRTIFQHTPFLARTNLSIYL